MMEGGSIEQPNTVSDIPNIKSTIIEELPNGSTLNLKDVQKNRPLLASFRGATVETQMNTMNNINET